MERSAYWVLDRMLNDGPEFSPAQWDLVVMLIRSVGGALPPMKKAG